MDKTHYIGIDIAKAKFDLAFFDENDKGIHKVFDNTKKGFSEMNKFFKEKGINKAHITLEATNVYWQDVSEYLYKKNDFIVSVVNPLQTASYAKCRMQRGKTDKMDALLLARYGKNEQPEPWKPLNEASSQLLKLVRQCEHLKDCKQVEQTRLRTADKLVNSSIKTMINTLNKQIISMQKKIKNHIKANDELYTGFKLLKTIPGIGDNTAAWLLAVLDNGERFGRGKQAACYAGLTPRPWQSGSSVKGRSCISKVGPSELRKILYMPAVVVSYGRHKNYQSFVNRLESKGKKKMEVIVAVMRKLITIAQAVLRTRAPYDKALHAG